MENGTKPKLTHIESSIDPLSTHNNGVVELWFVPETPVHFFAAIRELNPEHDLPPSVSECSHHQRLYGFQSSRLKAEIS